MPKKDDELIKHEGEDRSLSAPSYLAEESNMLGFEDMDRGDMTLPRLGLCQSMTPQRKKGDKYIEGLEEGQWFNTITGENFGSSVYVVPLLFYKTRIRFFPLEQGGGIRCQSRDFKIGVGDPGGNCERCPLAQFGEKKPECNKFFNYPAIAWATDKSPGPQNLLVVSFKSTGLKAASAWNSLMQIRRKNMFTGVYRFTSVEASNAAKQQWYAPVIRNADWVPEKMLGMVKQMFDAVSAAQREGRLKEDLTDTEGYHGGEAETEL